MAFINKSQRFSQEKPIHSSLGPGQYLGPLQYQQKQSYAPFSTTGPKLQTFATQKPQKPNAQTPGPGSYNVNKDIFSEKVLVSNVSQDIKIIEVPKESSNFKSSTKRMIDPKPSNLIPGPGTYEKYCPEISYENKKIQNKQKLEENKAKRNIIEDIMTVNKYQSIPSIPGIKQAYGYTENEKNELEINKNPIVSHLGIQNNSVGPGHYEQKSAFNKNYNNKGTGWSKSKVNRMAKKITKSEMLLGPGIYNVNVNLNPLYKYKPSCCFVSKSFRQPDPQKGTLANQHIANKYQSYASQLSQEPEFVKPEELNLISPGPGTYYPENVLSSIKLQRKPEKLQFFGSSSLRFKTAQCVASNQVGPGYYHLNPKLEVQSAKPKKQVPFQSEQERFEDIGSYKENPGPGSYDPKNQLENQLILKMQAGYKGQFGASEERFKEYETDIPGPGTYLGKEQTEEQFQFVPLVKMPDPNYYFKEGKNPKHNERTSFIPKKTAPPIGVYDLDFYDIQKKVQKKIEIDPSIMVKAEGMGFNSSEPRFKNLYNDNQSNKEKENGSFVNYCFFTLYKDLLQSTSEQIKPEEPRAYKQTMETPGIGFGNKDSRFRYNNSEKTIPGPGQYYDPHKNLWNKRTYNIEYTGLK